MARHLGARIFRGPYKLPLILLCILLFVGGWIYFTLPDVQQLKTLYPVVHYLGPDEPPLITLQKQRPRGWVSLGEVSRVAVGAIIVSEDWAYYQHNGYDPNQMKEAFREDWEEKKFARGASTITQQVARNVFLTKDKNLWRKAKELYLAVKIDELVGKKKTLETYLNVAEWGPGIFGIRMASHYYFQKEPSDLNAKEGAFLAMLLPSPIRYGQSFRKKRMTEYAQDTIESVLSKMTQAHYLTEEERIQEVNQPLSFEIVPSGGTPSGSPEPRPSEDPENSADTI
jgi:monofunctional biosynthetic peptidoglycan transglycosylase